MTVLNNKILKVVAERRSEVSFVPKDLTDEIIETLFEAARWVPSSFNEQPWRFYLGDRRVPGSFNKIYSLLSTDNQEWAKNVSLLVLSVTNKFHSRNGNENYYSMHDLGMASYSLALQAQSMGLVTHFMGGFDKIKAREALSIPSSFSIGSVIAVGYKGSNENLPPILLKRATSPRVRKDLSDLLTIA